MRLQDEGTDDVPGGGATVETTREEEDAQKGGHQKRGKKSGQALFQFHDTNMYEFKCSGYNNMLRV